MKTVTTLAFISTMLATLALAQTRHISMVKGSPTNYGPYGFDISWVDNSTQKYYLADRTNNAIDLVEAATDTFVGFIGKGQYSGSRPCPANPKDLRHCSGPNGVVTDGLGHCGLETVPGTSLKRVRRSRVRQSFGRSQPAASFGLTKWLMTRLMGS